jgi:hypothetical protein
MLRNRAERCAMRQFLFLLVCFVIASVLIGCGGPLQTPMPPRLDDDGQKTIDDAWEKALAPVNRHDHQTLLDLLMVSQAYQAGVDKLTFHSEKWFSGGTVAMDIHFDRLAPDQDRFEVKVTDKEGRLLREEPYSRGEVEKTYRELFVECEQLRRKKDQGKATPEESQKLAALEARFSVVEEIFPKCNHPEEPRKEP